MFKWLNNIFVKGWVEAKKFITTNGTSSQFVKGDGSLDDNSYALESDLDGLASETYVDTEIDNIEIGGRNLLPYTSDIWEYGHILSSSGNNSTISRTRTKGFLNFSPNTEYTFSRGTDLFTNCMVFEYDEDFNFIVVNSGEGIWMPNSKKFTFTTKPNTKYLRFVLDINFNASDIPSYEVQLEKGNKATNWSPAPEDQVTDFLQENEDSFDYLKNRELIALKTTNLTAGIGLTGGGTLAADRTFNVDFTEVATAAQGDLADTSLQPSDLNGYATENYVDNNVFSGDYNDLSNTPTIPTNNNQLINGAGYLTSVGWNDIIGTQSNINLSGFNDDLSYDNYQSWNLKTNGVQRTTIQSGGILDLVAGTNIGLSYGAGGVITITATDTNNNDIDYVSNVQLNGTSLDFTGVGNAFNSSVDLSSLLDNTNYYLDNLTFNTSNGILTASVNGATNQTVDLDGRYALPDDIILRKGIGANSTYRIGMASDTDAAGIGSIVIASLSSALGDNSGVIAGNKNNIEEYSEDSGIFAGSDNTIGNGYASVIIGGNDNLIGKVTQSAIIGGVGNIIGGDRSVILGGTGIEGYETDMVYAPNYKVTEDNNTDNAEYVAMVVQSQYGTSDPTAANYPEGTILIKYD